MPVIKKKIFPEYFEDVKSGRKKFELRLGDFAVAKGDTLFLQEWDGKKYTGRELSKKVNYVFKFDLLNLFWPKEEIEKRATNNPI